ncbi:hypothetical protein [Streptomyces sp. NPDC014344]
MKDILNTYPADLGGVDKEAMAKCIEECPSLTSLHSAPLVNAE